MSLTSVQFEFVFDTVTEREQKALLGTNPLENILVQTETIHRIYEAQ